MQQYNTKRSKPDPELAKKLEEFLASKIRISVVPNVECRCKSCQRQIATEPREAVRQSMINPDESCVFIPSGLLYDGLMDAREERTGRPQWEEFGETAFKVCMGKSRHAHVPLTQDDLDSEKYLPRLPYHERPFKPLKLPKSFRDRAGLLRAVVKRFLSDRLVEGRYGVDLPFLGSRKQDDLESGYFWFGKHLADKCAEKHFVIPAPWTLLDKSVYRDRVGELWPKNKRWVEPERTHGQRLKQEDRLLRR